MENKAHITVTGIKGYVKQEDFDALLIRVQALEKVLGLNKPKRIRTCPNGHTDSFEGLGGSVITTYPPIYADRFKCETCGVVFDEERRNGEFKVVKISG